MPMPFESFKQFLKEKNNATEEEIHEQALAMYNDYPEKLTPTATSEFVTNLKWKKVTELKSKKGITYEVRKFNEGDFYRIGLWELIDDEKQFVRYGEVDLRDEVVCSKTYKAVSLVRFYSKIHGDGLGTLFYKYLVKEEKIDLLSDTVQYFGARKLWAKLSKVPDVIVDVIDTKTCKIEKGIKVYHGDVNDAFDETIWSDESHDYIAKNIRLILRDVLL